MSALGPSIGWARKNAAGAAAGAASASARTAIRAWGWSRGTAQQAIAASGRDPLSGGFGAERLDLLRRPGRVPAQLRTDRGGDPVDRLAAEQLAAGEQPDPRAA